MSARDFVGWELLTDAKSIVGDNQFQPTHDPVVGWNDDGLRLQKSGNPDGFYLAWRATTGCWRVRQYPLGGDLEGHLRRHNSDYIRVFYQPDTIWGPEVLIINSTDSAWVALSSRPDPVMLASLHIRFPRPHRITYPGKL